MSNKDQPKRPRGRPKMTEEAKAAARAKREAAKPAKAASGQGRTTEHDKIRVEDLTDEQRYALMMQHAKKLATHDGLVEKATKDRKAARDLARAELGKSALHEIKLYNDLESDEGQARLKERVEMQARIARWAGMDVGHMDDLFGEDRTPIEDKAEAEGKRAGLKGDDPAPPSHFTGTLQQRWMKGYHDGQAVLHAGFKAKAQPFGAPPAKEPAQDATSEPEPNPKTYWFGMGYEARKAGYGGTIPDDVPSEFRDDWHNGWIKRADEIDQARREREPVAA